MLAAATLPTLVSAPLIGAWLDTHGRRRAAISVHLAIVAGALAALLAGAPAILCAGVAGLLQPLVTGGFSSMVPALAPGPRSAALDSMTYNVASVAGPAVVGVTAAVSGPEAAVALQATVALCGVPLVLALPDVEGAAPPPVRAARSLAASSPVRATRPLAASSPVRAARPFGGTLRAGLALLVRHPQLRAVTLVSSLSQVGWGLINVVAPALAVALGARSADGGLLLAAIAVGALVGAALLPRLHARGPLALVAGGTVAHGAGLGVLALAPDLPVALLAATVTGLPQGLAAAAMFSARARWSPPALQAQVFTSAAGMRTGLYALGAALAGPALAAGPRAAAAIAAAACALSAAGASGSRSPADRSGG